MFGLLSFPPLSNHILPTASADVVTSLGTADYNNAGKNSPPSP
jgi:hypothetical protein